VRRDLSPPTNKCSHGSVSEQGKTGAEPKQLLDGVVDPMVGKTTECLIAVHEMVRLLERNHNERF
jgi:hypothetical protein